MLIIQRHIRVGKRLVNQPNFMVKVSSDKHIGFAQSSIYGGKVKKTADEDY
jgi:small subunit ribosomal protein S9e